MSHEFTLSASLSSSNDLLLKERLFPHPTQRGRAPTRLRVIPNYPYVDAIVHTHNTNRVRVVILFSPSGSALVVANSHLVLLRRTAFHTHYMADQLPGDDSSKFDSTWHRSSPLCKGHATRVCNENKQDGWVEWSRRSQIHICNLQTLPT